ncbi:nucleoid-associated protein [Vagococcus acidifermentans]|uniref:Nucleoid-associated protein n=1 Tax=Vagococcus acidifermentans TaxID=564710 RepID=A0A430ATS8_9ENTE|nr:nucleoid-associated protein [Vagococcus acidifermentans]RSU11456.1 hypothetical protein CBF27_08130 [Vagococcus acidifermentans]
MEITQAILHVLDKEANTLVCSQKELDITEYAVKNYLESIVKRLQKADVKLGKLAESSDVAQVVTNDALDFVDQSSELAKLLFDLVAVGEDIPGGDLLVFTARTFDEEPLLGLVKLNYKPFFTHYVDYVDDEMRNNIIVNKTILPALTQKLDEFALINVDTLETQLVEKKYLFEGEKVQLWSERFLQVDPTPTVTENIKIVKKAVKEVADKYNEEKFISMSNVQQAVFESIEEDGIISKEHIADVVFEDNASAKTEYLEKMAQTRFTEHVPMDVPKYEKKYSKQKFKLANGIELSIPVDVFKNKDLVEFINNPDGTISVMIKNVEDIVSKF